MHPATSDRPVRILSVDGGGVRGLIPAIVLSELERLSGKPACQLFDLMAGTSSGALLVLALARPAPGRAPAHSAEDVVCFYEQFARRVFLRARKAPLAGLLGPRYSLEPLEQLLDALFGEARLSEALCEVLVTSYESERRLPFFFKSHYARTRPGYDFPMKQVGLAACAAPSYFSPVKIAAGRLAEYYSLLDGGLFAPNPALCAYVEARTLWPARPEIVLVSLGTGELTRPYPYQSVRRWGLLGWGRRLLDLVLQGASVTADYHLRQLLSARLDGLPAYWRFQVRLTDRNQDLDNAHPDNLRSLKLLAEQLIHQRANDLQRLAALLAS